MPELASGRQGATSTVPSALQSSFSCWRPPEERWMASFSKEAAMMALHPGGHPGSSRRVRLVPVRRSGMDHRAVARIVLALARQMAADEAVEPAMDEAVSSGEGTCSMREPGTSDGSAAARDDAAAPWAGAHRGQSARGGTAAGRCAANESVSASAGSGLAGRCSHQRHEGAHYLAYGTSSAGSQALPDRTGTAKTDEAAAVTASGGTP